VSENFHDQRCGLKVDMWVGFTVECSRVEDSSDLVIGAIYGSDSNQVRARTDNPLLADFGHRL